MPRIITFTANLLAETTYEFESWQEGKTRRAASESFQVGGKGINVSKMLNRLDAANAAICFPGGDFGPMCERWLESKDIALMPFRAKCIARSGVVVRSPVNDETTFLGVDSTVSSEAVAEAVAALNAIKEPFVFAICGSIQRWSDRCWDPLRQWIEERGERVTLAVDNYGASLLWLATKSPDIIKFNRDELELLFKPAERARETPDLLNRAASQYDCPRWVVTDGGNPVWLKEGDASPQSVTPPSVRPVSATGCGDIFFATVMDCLYNKTEYNLRSACELAADYAARSAAMPGIAEFEL